MKFIKIQSSIYCISTEDYDIFKHTVVPRIKKVFFNDKNIKVSSNNNFVEGQNIKVISVKYLIKILGAYLYDQFSYICGHHVSSNKLAIYTNMEKTEIYGYYKYNGYSHNWDNEKISLKKKEYSFNDFLVLNKSEKLFEYNNLDGIIDDFSFRVFGLMEPIDNSFIKDIFNKLKKEEKDNAKIELCGWDKLFNHIINNDVHKVNHELLKKYYLVTDETGWNLDMIKDFENYVKSKFPNIVFTKLTESNGCMHGCTLRMKLC